MKENTKLKYSSKFDEKFIPGNEIDNALYFGFAVTFVVFIKNVAPNLIPNLADEKSPKPCRVKVEK